MDIYTIIFLALAVFVFLRLRSVLGQRTGRSRIPVTGILLTLTAVALGAVCFDLGRDHWYQAINGPVIDRYAFVFFLVGYSILELLWSLWGKKDRNGPRYLTEILLTLAPAAVVCGLLYAASQGKWYSALKAAVTSVTSISGPARVVDGDTVVVGILLAMALCMGAALVLSFLHWNEWKAQRINPGPLHPKEAQSNPGPLHPKAQRVDPGFEREEWKAQKPGQGDGLKKAKPLDGLLRDHPSQRKADDPGIEREFNNVFMTTSKEGKQALIKRWMDRKKCDREEAMRLAIEELRRDNR